MVVGRPLVVVDGEMMGGVLIGRASLWVELECVRGFFGETQAAAVNDWRGTACYQSVTSWMTGVARGDAGNGVVRG